MNQALSGNMYGWVTKTWNPVGGRCLHGCDYCYVRTSPRLRKIPKYHGEPFLVEKELKKSLGTGKLYFVCSMNDLFADGIPDEWIRAVLERCQKYPENEYLFQSKNPARFWKFRDLFPKSTMLGVTIESNRDYGISKTPGVKDRIDAIKFLSPRTRIMLNIEPIMDFDCEEFVSDLKAIKPGPIFISIGADSERCGLPEPPPWKIKQLIRELEKVSEVRLKDKLRRLS